jgi:hypothetical protein
LTYEKLVGHKLRHVIVDLLKSSDINSSINKLQELPTQKIISTLFSSLCSHEDEVKWHAVTAMGVFVANLARENMESARTIIRRLMWSLNDESGGIGWGAPEAMAEIMACHEGLAKEYAHILVSYIRENGNFLEYELLQRGVIWGIGRLAQVKPQLLQSLDVIHYLLPYLESGDAPLRGLATWTLGLLGAKGAHSQLERLLGDGAQITLYKNRILDTYSIDELAREALELISSP